MKKRRNNHGRSTKSEVPLEQKEYRQKNENIENRKQKKPKTEKTEKKPEKKQKKNLNTTKFKRRKKFEDFNEKNGATYPQAKTTLRRGGSGTQQKLGANSTTKTTKPRKFTRKVSP